MKSAQALRAPLDHDAVRHLRPVELERKSIKFAALDHEVARVLGRQRGPSLMYAFLASAWYEFAGTEKLAEIKKKSGRTITPGDWIEVSYQQFMGITGTRAFASIVRWLRTLSERTHPCPWGRCHDEHPLIVVKRQGQSRPNRYRRWKCGEDVLVLRPRIASKRLSEVALQRVKSGQQLNGIQREPIDPIVATDTDEQQILLLNSCSDDSAQGAIAASELSLQEFKPSLHESPKSLAIRVQDISSREVHNSHHETSLREKTDFVGLNLQNTTANHDAAVGVEKANETDAVACEVVEAIAELARRLDSTYPDDRAWSVARSLARVVLETTRGEAAQARALLLRAISDRRLARAKNPVGLLIRGVVGDAQGQDRYLIALVDRVEPNKTETTATAKPSPKTHYKTQTGLAPGLEEALLDVLRHGHVPDSKWLRERDLPIEAVAAAKARIASDTETTNDTPLADRLAADDPARYTAKLEAILRDLSLPERLGIERRLDHPMLLGMCRAKLETTLQRETDGAAPHPDPEIVQQVVDQLPWGHRRESDVTTAERDGEM